MGKVLIAVGLLVVLVGVLIQAGLPLGRLPGDIVIRRGNSTIYLPIVTCLIASVVLSLLALLLRR
jgi:hypothetical protein